MVLAKVRSALVIALGLGLMIAAVVAPSGLVDHHAPALRAVLETSVALVGTLVAILALGRYRRSGALADLAIVCAVALLGWVHTLFGSVPDLISPYSIGNGVSERVELWGTVVVRTIAAGYLVVAGARQKPPTSPRTTAPRFVRAALIAPLTVGVVAIAILVWLAPIGGGGLLKEVMWPQSSSSVLLLVDAVLFFVAFFRLSRPEIQSDPFLGWIGAGSVLAGFSMICYALLPAGTSAWLRAGDLLRAGAVVTWTIGAISEIFSYWSKIAESARKEARFDVALELHDGLAQELALLAMYTYEPATARERPGWHQELQAAAERALAEARRAIAALASEEPVPFDADLEWTAESISGAGVDVHVEVDAMAAADLSHRESIVRIVREAVTNAVRHGGAAHIDITLEGGRSPALRIFDDGTGFDVDCPPTSGHLGLVSMRERAEAIGASFAVRSAPGAGTTVEVLWP